MVLTHVCAWILSLLWIYEENSSLAGGRWGCASLLCLSRRDTGGEIRIRHPLQSCVFLRSSDWDSTSLEVRDELPWRSSLSDTRNISLRLEEGVSSFRYIGSPRHDTSPRSRTREDRESHQSWAPRILTLHVTICHHAGWSESFPESSARGLPRRMSAPHHHALLESVWEKILKNPLIRIRAFSLRIRSLSYVCRVFSSSWCTYRISLLKPLHHARDALYTSYVHGKYHRIHDSKAKPNLIGKNCSLLTTALPLEMILGGNIRFP